ncbi:MAG: TPM domain-containing protein [Casimicrobiaceae bacterium]|nr:TPM domain-containing protein [Casimicrobiaceae bacterium]
MGSSSAKAPRSLRERLWAHLWSSRRAVNKALPEAALDRIEQAIARAEAGSSGQLRLVVEACWPLAQVRLQRPRERALDWFSRLRVWDTEHNNGVLVYLLFAEHDIEILADRGYNGRVSAAEWEAICRHMEMAFGQGDFERGLTEGIAAIGALMRKHFPAQGTDNSQPDRPLLV